MSLSFVLAIIFGTEIFIERILKNANNEKHK